MSTAAQIIEWVFSSPFIWMTLLGVVTAHTMRRHAIYASLAYAPLIEEKNENQMGRRMFFALSLGIAAALLLYFTQAVLNFSYSIGIWLIAFILMVKGKEPLAFLFAALVLGAVSFFVDGASQLYKILRYTGSYQLILGVLYLVGKKETYPVMQRDKEGDIHGEHMYKEVWLLPAAALSFGTAPINAISYVMIVMLLFSEIRIKRTTPQKYFRRHGLFMAVTGAALAGLSFTGNEAISLIGIFAVTPVFLAYWIVKEIQFRKRNKYFFKADDTGVQVLYVYQDTPGYQMGLKIGDLIVAINGRRVVSQEAIELFLEDRPPFIWLEIIRDSKSIEEEYKDYEKGIGDLGLIFTPKHPSKFELYPRLGFFRRLVKRAGLYFAQKVKK